MLTLKQFETFSLSYLFGTNVNYTLNDERSIRKGINFSKCWFNQNRTIKTLIYIY